MLAPALAANGFAIVPAVLGQAAVEDLAAAPQALQQPGRGGVRDLLNRVPAVRQLADSTTIRALIEPALGRTAIPVRAILFDKTPAANWKVPWHQDLTIAVREICDLPGYGPWTVKDGIQHVQPPAAILENMLAVRLHLDDCGEDNGPLRVLPGTHTIGRLTAAQIDALTQTHQPELCLAGRGDAILMRPLLLHASSPSATPARRRVIHIEFAAIQLPSPLRWFEEP